MPGNLESVVPPMRPVFDVLWKRFIIGDDEDCVKIIEPVMFSEIVDNLVKDDFMFQYAERISTDNGLALTQIPGMRPLTCEAYYTIVLAGINLILALKGSLLGDSRLFDPIDVVYPVRRCERDVSHSRSSMANTLSLNIDIYRRLNELVRTRDVRQFWESIETIVNCVSENMITAVAVSDEHPLNNNVMNYLIRSMREKIANENSDLKQDIIKCLQEGNYSENILCSVYSLILQTQMRNTIL